MLSTALSALLSRLIGIEVRVALTLALGLRARTRVIAAPVMLAAIMCFFGKALINVGPAYYSMLRCF